MLTTTNGFFVLRALEIFFISDLPHQFYLSIYEELLSLALLSVRWCRLPITLLATPAAQTALLPGWGQKNRHGWWGSCPDGSPVCADAFSQRAAGTCWVRTQLLVILQGFLEGILLLWLWTKTLLLVFILFTFCLSNSCLAFIVLRFTSTLSKFIRLFIFFMSVQYLKEYFLVSSTVFCFAE